MDRFKALVVTRDEASKSQSVAITTLGPARPHGGRRRCSRGVLHGELQGRTGDHRENAGGPSLSHGSRGRFVGTVKSSSHAEFKVGDRVILNGWGLGETHLGAYAQMARVKGDWLIPLPTSLSGAQAMAIGTAGYTAMLSLMALEKHGVTPASGPAVVTGAAGGVGSVAVALLAARGFTVEAVTGRAERGGLSQEPRRARDRRPVGIDGPGQGARQGALGLRHRRRRRHRPRQCHLHDLLSRRGGGMRKCRRHGSADVRGTVHPARRRPSRHRLLARRRRPSVSRPGTGLPRNSTGRSSPR